MMQKRFDDIVRGLFPEGGTVLLAVSGGMDSMCMANLFLHSAQNLSFAVANCNFHLRGDESDGDSAMVKSWCERNSIVCHQKDFSTKLYAQDNSLSIEMAARELRYEWFDSLCREYSYSALVVAHNLNDNAETMMLNLLRGTGIKGMLGIQAETKIPVDGSQIKLVRPLLAFSRTEIEDYVKANKIDYRDDHTNFDNEYRRNKLRNLVFPIFKEINPSFLSAFAKDIANLSQVSDVADAYYKMQREKIVLYEDADQLRIDVKQLRENDHVPYMLYRLLEPYGFNSSDISSLTSLLSSDGTFSGKVFTCQHCRLVTSSSEISVTRLPLSSSERCHDSYSDAVSATCLEHHSVRSHLHDFSIENSVVVRGSGNYELSGIRFSVEIVDRTSDLSPKQPAGISMFDAEAFSFPFIVRKWKNGDWMKPIGLHGRKKLSDMFVDLKMSLTDKERALVAVVPGMNPLEEEKSIRVASLLGKRVDESVKVKDDTDKVVIVRILL